ncbi:MAG: Dabb family protein [Bdellovibrionales bacterium]
MLRHIVLMTFQNELGEEEIAEAVERFFDLRETIEEVKAMEHGMNISVEGLDQGFTHCFLLDFDDEAARDRYLAHPAHQDFVGYVMPLLANGLVVDFMPKSSAA